MAEEKNEEKGLLKEKARTIHTKSRRTEGFSKFLKETIVELKKVVWPTKKQLIINTTVVIIACILMSVFIFAADYIIDYPWRYFTRG